MPYIQEQLYNFTVSSAGPSYVSIPAGGTAKVVNAGANSVYYKTTSDVDSGDTEVTAGSSAELTAGQYFITATGLTSQLFVQIYETSRPTDITVADDLTVTDDATVTDDLAVTGDLAVTSTTTLTGGITASSPDRVATFNLDNVAFATAGTDTAPTAKTEYFASLFLPVNKTLTGAGILLGTASTNKVVFFLHNSAGTLVAQTASAGTASGTSDTVQEIAFTATYAAVGPARYWLGYQADNASEKFRAITAASAATAPFTGSKALAAFGTGEAITPATSFTDVVGPIGYVY